MKKSVFKTVCERKGQNYTINIKWMYFYAILNKLTVSPGFTKFLLVSRTKTLENCGNNVLKKNTDTKNTTAYTGTKTWRNSLILFHLTALNTIFMVKRSYTIVNISQLLLKS